MKPVRDVCASYDWIESISFNRALQIVLSHNDEPTSLQATSVATSKELIDLAHECITKDIENLENALDLLCARRRALNRLSEQHAGALSKFRRLPDEILLEIFLRACGDESFRVGCLDDGPWKLRAVCRKWASIVEGCSQLWSNMAVYVGYEDVHPAAFARALQFCGSRPIQMTLSSMNEHYGDVQGNFRGVLDMVISSSSRWETLSIESYGGLFHFVLELFPRLEQHLPLLRSLKFEGAHYGDIESITSRTLPALLAAPMLESVHIEIESVRIAQLLDIVPIPCQQIRRLLCYSMEDEPASHLLLSKEKFPLLKHYGFISSQPSTRSVNEVPASSRVKHDGVVHLVTSQTDVLNSFSFPSLCTFSIGDPRGKPAEPLLMDRPSGMIFKRASDMLFTSRCSLVSLVLSYNFTLVKEFLQILGIVPTLEILDMRVAWSNGMARDWVLCDFFTALGNRTNNSTFSFLPALQNLRLEIAALSRLCNDEWDCRFGLAERRSFRFVSPAVKAITERSKCPSEFRVFFSKC